MKTGSAVAALALFIVAGCGRQAPATSNTAAMDRDAPDPYEAKIDALSDQQRKITFYKAIYDVNDYQCDQVVKVTDRPRDNGRRAWTVTCSDTGDFYITLQPGGMFSVSGAPSAKTKLPKGTRVLPPGTK